MRKNIRKFISLLLTLVLLLATAAPAYAVAPVGELVSGNVLLTPSEHATYSVLARNAPTELIAVLEEQNIPFSSTSRIDIVPEMSRRGGDALVVTNTVNDSVHSYITVFIDRTGKLLPISPPGSTQQRDGETITLVPTGFSISITAVAVFNTYFDGTGLTQYYQPTGAYFTYYKTDPCTVTQIATTYICDGSMHSYPDFVQVNPFARHTILVSAARPLENTVYSRTYPLASNRVIYVIEKQCMTFEFTVDGRSDFYTVEFVDF